MRKTRKAAAKRTGEAAKPKSQPAAVERPGSWHLARTETERRLSDFEFRLERLAQAYYRWKAACLAAVCDVPLTGDDVAVLNVVRMGDEPKRLSEIGQLLNRVDVPNLQYATRKLVKAGLIETEGCRRARKRAIARPRPGTPSPKPMRRCAPQPCRRCWRRWTAGRKNPRPPARISNWSRASIPRPRRSRSRGGISLSAGAHRRRVRRSRRHRWTRSCTRRSTEHDDLNRAADVAPSPRLKGEVGKRGSLLRSTASREGVIFSAFCNSPRILRSKLTPSPTLPLLGGGSDPRPQALPASGKR